MKNFGTKTSNRVNYTKALNALTNKSSKRDKFRLNRLFMARFHEAPYDVVFLSWFYKVSQPIHVLEAYLGCTQSIQAKTFERLMDSCDQADKAWEDRENKGEEPEEGPISQK